MLGLARGTVRLVEHTPLWAKYFEREKQRLAPALSTYALDIQHIGSTAVPGLAAKPIVDIGVALADLDHVEPCTAPLAALGYVYYGDSEGRGDHFFALGCEKCRTCYLHMVQVDSKAWRDYLLFRDYLIGHPGARQRYENLKHHLVDLYKDDRRSFTKAKATLIAELLAAAKSRPASPELRPH